MWNASKVATLALLGACATGEPQLAPTEPAAPSLLASAAPTAEGCLLDPAECPPRAWVDYPADLPPGITVDNSNCDLFPFPPVIIWDFHPTAGCHQKQWGESGIYRQQARDLHLTRALACGGMQADIDEIRLCSTAWVNRPTPYGNAGGAGCVVTKIEVTCGV